MKRRYVPRALTGQQITQAMAWQDISIYQLRNKTHVNEGTLRIGLDVGLNGYIALRVGKALGFEI